MSQNKFTETDTETFYNAEDSLYRSFWDSEGSLHWGYFLDLAATCAEDFIPACQRWNEYMLENSRITASSKVLDIGCGNGNTAIWLTEKTGCEVVGIDLSNVRISNALEKARNYPSLRLQFHKASVTNLPFSDRLSWIYETKDTQQLEDKYDAWSAIYDTELDQPYRISPIRSAHALAKVLPNKDARILDAGAGTGMVGEALAELGYTNLTAIDLSEQMLEAAREKQVYQTLYRDNLEAPVNCSTPSSFDAIISVGVFTFGHAQPKALLNLDTLLVSGGFFVLTVRVDYHDNNETLQELLEDLPWILINRDEFTIFEQEPIYTIVFHKK
ncbi:MAG: methyltransferase domain-containing protein [Symploca sp. SIO3E6]|nr:methyltransferase domain-containing protein [Caldora sp. SIO3E6]